MIFSFSFLCLLSPEYHLQNLSQTINKSLVHCHKHQSVVLWLAHRQSNAITHASSDIDGHITSMVEWSVYIAIVAYGSFALFSCTLVLENSYLLAINSVLTA